MNTFTFTKKKKLSSILYTSERVDLLDNNANGLVSNAAGIFHQNESLIYDISIYRISTLSDQSKRYFEICLSNIQGNGLSSRTKSKLFRLYLILPDIPDRIL